MAEETDIVRETRILRHMIHDLIVSRQMSSMRIPRTEFDWVTYFFAIREDADLPLILVDHVKGFETALARGSSRKILFEFKDKLGVPCRFETTVRESSPRGILVEFPQEIQRIERRKYFRVEAPLDSVITFSLPDEVNESAALQNLSAGGIAMRFREEGVISVGDELRNLHINIPGRDREAGMKLGIPGAVVRRVEKMEGGKALVAIEFERISENTRKQIIAFVLKIQRVGLRRLGRSRR